MAKPVTMKLTPEEAREVEERREQAKQTRWVREGILLAATQLDAWGKESNGGDGERVRMDTGKRWGEEFFNHARMLREWVKA